jgi:hypothetical protein
MAPKGSAAVINEIINLVYSASVLLRLAKSSSNEDIFTSSYPNKNEPKAALIATRYTYFLSFAGSIGIIIILHYKYKTSNIIVISLFDEVCRERVFCWVFWR